VLYCRNTEDAVGRASRPKERHILAHMFVALAGLQFFEELYWENFKKEKEEEEEERRKVEQAAQQAQWGGAAGGPWMGPAPALGPGYEPGYAEGGPGHEVVPFVCSGT
jgi:hypothetical protein